MGVALAVHTLLAIKPELIIEKTAPPVFGDSVAVLKEIAAALAGGDFERNAHS